jgi:chromosome segregation ATPase
MQVSNDTPALNYIEYFTKQMPIDLANMAALRDELATRQGGLSAAKDALADRDKAANELITAKDQANAIVNSAKEKEEKAKTLLSNLKDREKILADNIKIYEESILALNSRKATSDTREMHQQQTQKNLDAKETKLIADQAALDARVKAFQAKVAALSA